MAKASTPQETKCTKCDRLVGVKSGFVAIDDTCAPCSGKRALQCQGCTLVYADIGAGACPFCKFSFVRPY